jgi:hypothetical protein
MISRRTTSPNSDSTSLHRRGSSSLEGNRTGFFFSLGRSPGEMSRNDTEGALRTAIGVCPSAYPLVHLASEVVVDYGCQQAALAVAYGFTYVPPMIIPRCNTLVVALPVLPTYPMT